jgi:hypothetical protein
MIILGYIGILGLVYYFEFVTLYRPASILKDESELV